MASLIKNNINFTKPFQYTVFVWFSYAILTWFAPVNVTAVNRYSVSEAQLRLIGVTISLPTLLIWLFAIYGASAVNKYSKTIGATKEGRAYRLLSMGINLLVFQLIASSFLNLCIKYFPSMSRQVKIFNVYEAALFAVVAFVTIALGSDKLLDVGRIKKNYLRRLKLPIMVIALVGYFYVRAVLANKYRLFPQDVNSVPTFGISDAWIFLTIVPMYLVAWFAGMTAIVNILDFQNKVSWPIYRNSFQNFARGFALIIGMSITLQFFSQANSYFAGLSLGRILIVVYVLLAFIIAGYIYVAKGAKSLLKLETV